MSFPIEKVRAETPGCKTVLHFNNAGAALMPQPVYEVVQNHQQLELTTGGYEADEAHTEDRELIYQHIADLLATTPFHIALQDNATRGWQLAFFSIPWQAGDRIITSQLEYASNFIPFLQIKKERGVMIDVIPNTAAGIVDVEKLHAALDDRVKLVAITHMPTGSGAVNPVEMIGDLLRGHPAFYLIDACQSVGQKPLDLTALHCDFLSATGRKYLRGPRGTGFLYASERALRELVPPVLDLHGATWTTPDNYEVAMTARRYETWESNRAADLGLGAAAAYYQELGPEKVWHRIQTLRQSLQGRLEVLPRLQITDPPAAESGIVSFVVAGLDPRSIVQGLRERKINIVTSSASAARLDMENRQQTLVLRASVHYYNTNEEVDRFVSALEEVIAVHA